MAQTLEQKIAAAERKLAALKERSRAESTRQKIVVGAAVISKAMTSPSHARLVLDALQASPPREHDRKLIDALADQLKSVINNA